MAKTGRVRGSRRPYYGARRARNGAGSRAGLRCGERRDRHGRRREGADPVPAPKPVRPRDVLSGVDHARTVAERKGARAHEKPRVPGCGRRSRRLRPAPHKRRPVRARAHGRDRNAGPGGGSRQKGEARFQDRHPRRRRAEPQRCDDGREQEGKRHRPVHAEARPQRADKGNGRIIREAAGMRTHAEREAGGARRSAKSAGGAEKRGAGARNPARAGEGTPRDR